MSHIGTAETKEGLTEQRVPLLKPRSNWAAIASRLLRQRSALVGIAVVLVMVGFALFAPIIAPYDPIQMQPSDSLQPPNQKHLLGTDIFGRDVFSRIVHGASISLQIGVVSVALAASIGVILGLISGYSGSHVDETIMGGMDVMLAFPGILLALTIVAFMGPGQNNVILALGIASIPLYARLVRGSVLSAKHNLYVEAARAVGSSPLRITIRHILPNILSPLVVVCTLGIAWAIMNGAALSFLGLGAIPPTPEWGTMLSEGREYLRVAPWIATFPGLAIMILVIGVNLLGDGLRVALDPRTRK